MLRAAVCAELSRSHIVFFFEQLMKIAGIFIADLLADFFYRKCSGGKQVTGLNEAFALKIGGKRVRGIFFHKPADKIGRLLDRGGIFFQRGGLVVILYIRQRVQHDFLFIGGRGA